MQCFTLIELVSQTLGLPLNSMTGRMPFVPLGALFDFVVAWLFLSETFLPESGCRAMMLNLR